MSPRWNRLALVAIVLLAASVRVIHAPRYMKSFDEFVATFVAAGGRLEIVNALKNHNTFTNLEVFDHGVEAVMTTTTLLDNGNAELYNFLYHFWVRAVGTGDVETRLLSVIFGVATVGLTAWLARAMTHSRVAGLLAALLLALHPLHVQFSNTTRGYALGTLLVTLSSAYFVIIIDRVTRPRRWHYIAYGVTTVAALFTHYFAGYAFAVQGLYALIRLRDRYRWGPLAATWAGVAATFGAWLFIGPGREGLERTLILSQRWVDLARSGIGNVDLTTPGVILRRLVQMYVEYVGIDIYWTLVSAGVRVRYLLPLLAAPVLLVGLGMWSRLSITPHHNASAPLVRREGLLTLLLAMAPFAFATTSALTSGHTVSFQVQYATFTLPFLAISLALLFRSARRRWPWAAAATLGIIFAYMLASLAHPRFPPTQNPFPAVSQRILSQYRPGDTVIYPHWDVAWMNTIYLNSDSPIAQRTEVLRPYHILLRRPGSDDTVIFDLATSGLPRPIFW